MSGLPCLRSGVKGMTEDWPRDDETWHWWSLGRTTNEAFHIGRLPGRKRVALYLQYGSRSRPLAYFQNEKDALAVIEFMDKLAGWKNDD